MDPALPSQTFGARFASTNAEEYNPRQNHGLGRNTCVGERLPRTIEMRR